MTARVDWTCWTYFVIEDDFVCAGRLVSYDLTTRRVTYLRRSQRSYEVDPSSWPPDEAWLWDTVESTYKHLWVDPEMRSVVDQTTYDLLHSLQKPPSFIELVEGDPKDYFDGRAPLVAIIVREIRSAEADGVMAVVEHSGRELVAMVAGDPARLRAAVNSTLMVELAFITVVSARLLDRDVPVDSGLFPLASGDVRIVGTVYNRVDARGGYELVAGSAFILFEGSSFDFTPPHGVGLEVVVAGLRFFPMWT